MPRAAPQARRRLEEAVEAAEGRGRYVDLELHLRRVVADFVAPVPEDHAFVAGGVEFVTVAAGQTGVPVRSLQVGASAEVPDGAPIDGGGVLRCEVVLRAGGRWDMLDKRYDGAARKPLVFDLMESQIALTRWYAGWLARYKERQRKGRRGRVKDVRTALGYGNRGSGKTWVCLLLILAAALEVPDSVCWLVSENRPASQEDVHETLDRMLPSGWGRWHGQPMYRWRLINGSRIWEKTADDPSALKSGRVDVLLINEAAKMPHTVWGYATARTKDRGGLALMASNPPTLDKPRGIWVFKMDAKWKESEAAGEWYPFVSFQMQSADNATIDRGADEDLAILMRSISPELAAADVDGAMTAPGERLIYPFDIIVHGRQHPPELGDLTEAWTRARLGRAYRYLAGVDFQDSPSIVASFWKLYGTMERPILWCVSDFAERGSEDDFLDALETSGVPIAEGETDGIGRDTILWVGDSSGQWQDSRHRGEAARQYPPSFSFWKQRLYAIVPPAVKKSENSEFSKNPPWLVSLGNLNRWIGTHRLQVAPLAKKTAEAFAQCQARPSIHGVRAEARYAHVIDCARYVSWWVDPPHRRPARSDGERVRSNLPTAARPRLR